MSNYQFPTVGGLRLKYGFWDIGLWMQADIGVGPMFMLGYDDPGSGWTSVAIIDGPYDEGTWSQIMRNAGGMGTYTTGKMPLVNSLLAKYFDTNPTLPVETNATPFTVQDFNYVWTEYFTMNVPAGQTHPVISRKP